MPASNCSTNGRSLGKLPRLRSAHRALRCGHGDASDVGCDDRRCADRRSAFYLRDESTPADRDYLFGYNVVIANTGDQPVQLDQPALADHRLAPAAAKKCAAPAWWDKPRTSQPGEAFKYASFARLKTPWGTMEGEYQMRRDDGSEFDARIERFYLTTEVAVATTEQYSQRHRISLRTRRTRCESSRPVLRPIVAALRSSGATREIKSSALFASECVLRAALGTRNRAVYWERSFSGSHCCRCARANRENEPKAADGRPR